ncbi:MAG: carbon storage regulator CsrA [Acidobacteria bacterium]|nr:carbon storage regulator CsrA [Acidobacteriota bacterium]MBI3657027.1 carbon storage regulator CsrA [Acidobacteriota bacterium]
MLVFTRKKEERLMIGNDIEITILSVGKDSVKLGIKAPRSIAVHRWEVYEAIRAQNLAASNSAVLSPEILKKFSK